MERTWSKSANSIWVYQSSEGWVIKGFHYDTNTPVYRDNYSWTANLCYADTYQDKTSADRALAHLLADRFNK